MTREEILEQAGIPLKWAADCFIDSESHIFTPVFDGDGQMTSTGEQAYQKFLLGEEKTMSVNEQLTLLKAQIKAQTDRSDFVEDCIAEMGAIIYQ